VALAAAVLAAVVISAGAYGVVHRQRQERREQSALLVNQALGQAAALMEQASSLAEQPPQAAPLWRDALAAADRAEKTLAAGELDSAVRERVVGALSDLRSDAAKAKNDRLMWERLERARDLAQELQDSDYVRKRRIEDFVFGLAASPAYAEAFREYGIDVNVLPPPEAALKIRERPIRSALVAALEAWYYLEPTAAGGRLLEIAQAADPDPLRNRVRAAVASGDIDELEQLAADPSATDLPAFTILLVGDVLREHGQHAEALLLLERARRRYPQDFWVNDVLGLHYVAADPPDLDEAARCFAAALAIRPESPLGWSNLGSVLTQQGRYAEAVRLLEEGVRLRPDFTTGHQRLVEAGACKGNTTRPSKPPKQGKRGGPTPP
jgi:tetratricopeptide (TPR) repeat protein